MKYVVTALLVGLAFAAYMTANQEVQQPAYPTQMQKNVSVCLDFSAYCNIRY